MYLGPMCCVLIPIQVICKSYLGNCRKGEASPELRKGSVTKDVCLCMSASSQKQWRETSFPDVLWGFKTVIHTETVTTV